MVWLFGGTCRSPARLDGKTVVVTGANTGIGKETALDLASRGGRVILAVRDLGRGQAAAEDIRQRLTKEDKGVVGEVLVEQLDLASLRSVRACARRILDNEKTLHILVNNAGVLACEKAYTEDGFDMPFGTNHLGHFLFTLLLLPRLRASGTPSEPSRIVNLSSMSYSFYDIDFDDLNYEKYYRPFPAYSRSKLANLLFTRELARRLRDAEVEGVHTYCVHPGAVDTEISRGFNVFLLPWMYSVLKTIGSLFAKTPLQGAQTTIYCAVDEKAASESGLYYVDCSAMTPLSRGRDDSTALRLWDVSMDMVGLRGYDPVAALEPPAWTFQEVKERERRQEENV